MAILWKYWLRVAALLLSLSMGAQPLQGQETVEGYIRMALQGDRETPVQALPQLRRENPNDSRVLYLEALLTEDGEQAVALYRRIARDYPSSTYADDALLKIGEYLYARGLYIQASIQLKKILIHYPRSDLIYPSIRMFLNALLVVGNRDTARFYAQVFARKYPDITFDLQTGRATSLPQSPGAAAATAARGDPPATVVTTPPAVASGRVRLQLGAFGVSGNAQRLKRQLEALNYRIIIERRSSGGRNIFVVLAVGFASREAARSAGELLKENYGIDYLVLAAE